MVSRLRVLIPLVTGLFLMLSSPAFAHVTVNPDEAAKGGFTAVSFRVPNERDDSGTIQLEVEFPAEYPIASVSVKPKAGWTANVEKTPLAEPVGGEGEEITEAVSRITWTGGRIGPGEFDEFDVSMGPLPGGHRPARVPDSPDLRERRSRPLDRGDAARAARSPSSRRQR